MKGFPLTKHFVLLYDFYVSSNTTMSRNAFKVYFSLHEYKLCRWEELIGTKYRRLTLTGESGFIQTSNY